MYVAVYRFSYKYREIMAGTYCDDLFKETYHERTIGILKGAMGKFVFNTPDILKLELSAQVILSFLLDAFRPRGSVQRLFGCSAWLCAVQGG